MPFKGDDARGSNDSIQDFEVTGNRNSDAAVAEAEESFDDFDASAENPYNELGFGFTAYFNMLRTFVCIFVMFTLIMSPAMIIYGTTDGLTVASNAKTQKAKWTLGNLGFSGATCVSQYATLTGSVGTRELACQAGTLGELIAWGVIPEDLDDNDDSIVGWKNNGFSYCGNYKTANKDPANPTIPEAAKNQIATCTDENNFNSAQINADFISRCTGQKSCTIDLASYQTSTVAANCNTDKSRVYLQYDCTQSLETVNTKRTEGLAIVCLGIFVSLLFLIAHWYLK
jgi:hypothetical protein